MNKNVILRRASMDDAALLLQWKNERSTLENSFCQHPVAEEEHLKWLQQVIQDPHRQLFVLEIEGKPVGQLRLDLKPMEMEEEIILKDGKTEKGVMAEISYGVGEKFRGKGYGRILLEEAQTLAETFCISLLKAEVLLHNEISRTLFCRLGYEEIKKEDRYEYRKSCF